MPKSKSPIKKISLALQGGGAHGTLTWGVLDRILEEPSLMIEAISATSSGAMNAAVMISGLEQGGVEPAKKALGDFWYKVYEAANYYLFSPNAISAMWELTGSMLPPFLQNSDWFNYLSVPCQQNNPNTNSLATILDRSVDYKYISQSKIKLFVNTSDVKSGKLKVFSNHDIIDNKALLASACLPYIMETIPIDDTSYWDGYFTGNPSLSPLIKSAKTSDILLVRVLPIEIEEIFHRPSDIIDRADEISSNSLLMQEVKFIETINNLIASNQLKNDKYRIVKIYSIDCDKTMAGLNRSSKLGADWTLMLDLKKIGRQLADTWIKTYLNGENSGN